MPLLKRADYVKTSNDELELVLADCGLTLDQLMRDCSVAEWVVTEGSHGGWVASRKGHSDEVCVGSGGDGG